MAQENYITVPRALLDQIAGTCELATDRSTAHIYDPDEVLLSVARQLRDALVVKAT